MDQPTGNWQMLNVKTDAETIFSVDPNFYIFTKKVD